MIVSGGKTGKGEVPYFHVVGCVSSSPESQQQLISHFFTGEMSEFKPDSRIHEQVCQARRPGEVTMNRGLGEEKGKRKHAQRKGEKRRERAAYQKE